jgi:hypothetical protein
MSGGQQGAMDRALARQQSLLRKATTDAKRLEAADQCRAQGDVRVAGMVYVRLALRRPPNATTETAKKRLADLQAEARQKIEELDQTLAGGGDAAQPAGEKKQSSDTTGPKIASDAKKTPDKPEAKDAPDKVADESADQPAEGQADDDAGGRIVAIFRQYDKLIMKYGELPVVGPEIKGHVAKLRHQPEYAVILNEPAAVALLRTARRYEHDHHVCCAYWTYKQAAELVPAPSAVLASDRFDELSKDPDVVASAETCRELKWCHQAYLRAEQLLKVRPERAKEVFAEIVRRAPEDSEVYRAAKRQLD